ncbi:hypothetical protein GCM10018785_45070 [Streptomyces longispororuber]|uniref:Uncharacterized protein n=1 Tax=Streptomyces longispororuber TaxID=68230 RepID=A0A919DSH4_9ACTN|nr:hypothetical protein [Streptomyces longispororuber]GHE71805.1 hypothetical protein GCM10018785_45070 [Streptomyces longispororuber]
MGLVQGYGARGRLGRSGLSLLIVGWGAFIHAGMVALYFLARALWAVDDDQAAPSSTAAPGTGAPELRTPNSDG